MRYSTLSFFLLLLASCSCKQSIKVNSSNTDKLLSEVMSNHGVKNYATKNVSFSIEDTEYTLSYPNGRALFSMTRTYESVTNKAIYDGGYIKYFKNDSLQPDDSYPYQIIERSLYGLLSSLSLPYGLTDPGISSELINEVSIRNKDYYVLKTTAKDIQEQEENIIILYISKDQKIIEYIALDYNDIALQKQFRRLTNSRRINDILFQDASIFVSQDTTLTLEQYYTHYNNPQLKHTQDIRLQNIKVNTLR